MSQPVQKTSFPESLLQRELAQRKPFASVHEEAFLALQRTASLLMQQFARRLRDALLTPAQYNVLRILRGAKPDSLTCSTIGERLVTPGPDVTRLVDRLVRRGLVERRRDGRDRRVVRVRINVPGLEILAGLDGPVESWLENLLDPLPAEDLRELVSLLAALRDGERAGSRAGT